MPAWMHFFTGWQGTMTAAIFALALALAFYNLAEMLSFTKTNDLGFTEERWHPVPALLVYLSLVIFSLMLFSSIWKFFSGFF